MPYDKGGESDAQGGWLPNYYVPTGYFIDWSRAAVHRLRTATIADVKRRTGDVHKIKSSDETTRAAVIRNPQYYFRQGVTFSPTGIYSPTFRLGSATVFGNKGSTIFFKDQEAVILLGVLVSPLARYLLKSYLSHTVETGEEVLTQLVLPELDAEASSKLQELVDQIIAKQKADPRYPYHLHEQREIDALVYKLYGLAPDDIREIELWYCRRYPALANAQGVLADVLGKHAAYLRWARHMLTSFGTNMEDPIALLIAQGESSTLEFKRTACVDGMGSKGSMKDKLVREVVAFMNSTGGTLLLGVDDDGNVPGLAADYAAANPQKQDRDGYRLFLDDVIGMRIGKDKSQFYTISFAVTQGKDICRIDITPIPDLIFLNDDLIVRRGTKAEKLSTKEALEHQKHRKV